MAERWERIRVATAHGVATLTLNRPEKRNALDALTISELKQAITACAGDETRVFVLRGNGPDFCAGADLEHLARMAASADPLANLDDAAALGQLLVLMRRTEQPIVAVVQGVAAAGGAGLATACDLIVAGDTASFVWPEVQIGFVPAMVTALLRRALGEKRIFELITLGRRIDAAEAQAIGLVARVFPDARLDELANAFIQELAARPPSAIRLCKRLLYGIDALAFEDAIARGAEINVIARATPEFREGVQRFLERKRQ